MKAPFTPLFEAAHANNRHDAIENIVDTDPVAAHVREIIAHRARTGGGSAQHIGFEPRRGQAVHVAGTAWSSKRYLNIALLKDQQVTGAITA